MTALSDALVTAQRTAIGALEKAYLAGLLDDGDLASKLAEIGCPDTVDAGHLLSALDTIREYGASAPANGAAPKVDEPMTDKQRAFITSLCGERSAPLPDFAGLSKVQASEIIASLQDGSYNPARWAVPF